MAEISPKRYSSDLQKVLFPDNAFYKKSLLDTVDAGFKTIEIPSSGITGTATVGDYPSLPLTIAKRTDSLKSYTTSEVYLTNPVLVEREDEILINYNKMQDIINASGLILNSKCADIAAHEFAPTSTVLGNVIPSTGTATRTKTIKNGTTAAKRIVIADLLSIRKIFNRMNLGEGFNIWGLLTPDQVDDLFLIAQLTDYDKTGELGKIRNGQIGMVLGMNLMMRYNSDLGTNGVYYTSSGVKGTFGATTGATDTAAAIFWSDRAVRHAEGFAKTVINRDAPGYKGGTIIEAMVRFGATKQRTDEVGTAAIYEAV